MIDEMNRLRARVRALEEQVADLEEEKLRLQEELDFERYGEAGWEPPREFGLTRKEAGFLKALIGRERCTKEYLFSAIYSVMEDPPQMKIIDVFVCKLRAKLRPYGIRIGTIWGVGYELAPDMREALLSWGRPEEACSETVEDEAA